MSCSINFLHCTLFIVTVHYLVQAVDKFLEKSNLTKMHGRIL